MSGAADIEMRPHLTPPGKTPRGDCELIKPEINDGSLLTAWLNNLSVSVSSFRAGFYHLAPIDL